MIRYQTSKYIQALCSNGFMYLETERDFRNILSLSN